MKFNKLLSAVLVLMLIVSLTNNYAEAEELPLSYECNYTTKAPSIDGVLNEKVWQSVGWSDNFVDILGKNDSKPEQSTRMKMLWDEKYLYVAAFVEENNIWGALENRDAIIYRDNDFELFIDPDGDAVNYYELEINALGTLMDLFMNKPYNEGGKAQISWDYKGILSSVKIYGSLNNPEDEDIGWTLELAIPWENFGNGNAPIINDVWRVNYSRVQWHTDVVDGKYVKAKDVKGKNLPEENWVWSPQGKINMHIPEKWGRVSFVKKPIDNSLPVFWVWMSGRSDWELNKWKTAFQRLSSAGIKGLLLSADTTVLKRVIPLAHCYGIQVHAWIWTMNRGDAKKEWLSVNALGKSLAEEKAYVDYYKFMCPALLEVRNFLQNIIAGYFTIEGLQGIHFDYIRYVDVFLPKELQPKYNLKQKDIMPEFDYGYHPYMRAVYKKAHGVDPMDILDYEHDKTWLDFRLKVLDTTVVSLRQKIKSNGFATSAAVFPSPAMSRKMVRQDWEQWGLDCYFPMIYHNFYGKKISWIKKIVKQDVKAVGSKSKVFAGLYLPALKNKGELSRAIKAAFTGGADGVSFFGYGALSDEMLEEIRELGVLADK